MKRNGMCPICYLKKMFTHPEKISKNLFSEQYQNPSVKTPPMGWSSWNTFKNQIDEDLILATAKAMKDKGLLDAGYNYVNLDDCWHSSMRDDNGDMQGDLTRFNSGIPALVAKINELGLKVGIYSSNGTLTCEDLPASLRNEMRDAMTFAKWGIEFFKYDFCHNEPITGYAPLLDCVSIAPLGGRDIQTVPCSDALLYGLAKLMKDDHADSGLHISGLDNNEGMCEFKNIYAPQDGDYVLTLQIRKKGEYDKYLIAQINDTDIYEYDFPSQKFWNYTARFQKIVHLNKGVNTLKLFNPIGSRADSAMIQYHRMGQCLLTATKTVAKIKNQPEKPILFSICEWGKNEPFKWGANAGNIWRTTGDIAPYWIRIMMIYEQTVKLYEYSKIGAYNDPDMLEVGNGDLSDNQNKSHFSLWCMMNSPLILGNDLRVISDNILKIVTNKALIALNQDALGKAGKRISTNKVDIIAKPLANGDTAVCFFNKQNASVSVDFDMADLQADSYVKMPICDKYDLTELWSGESLTVKDRLSIKLGDYETKVYRIQK